jgi:hypothetical protein
MGLILSDIAHIMWFLIWLNVNDKRIILDKQGEALIGYAIMERYGPRVPGYAMLQY